MSTFLFSTGHQTRGRTANVVADMERAGFEKLEPIAVKGGRLLCFKDLDRGGYFVSKREGSSCFGFGTFFYKGYFGRAALDQWHDDLLCDQQDPHSCSGHYSIVHMQGDQVSFHRDQHGVTKHYMDDQTGVISNSFLLTLASVARPEINVDSCYQYAWQGSLFGSTTFAREVTALPTDRQAHFDGERFAFTGRELTAIPNYEKNNRPSLDECAREQVERLRKVMENYAPTISGRVRSALSGGFDSRLLLALLLEYECDPELYVYGADRDDDVVIAKLVADRMGLQLDHVDKSKVAPPEDPLSIKERFHRDFIVFDGWKNSGNVAFGSDYHDRIGRIAQGRFLMNGSVGEIYRNFFYLPPYATNLRKNIWSFYSRFHPDWCTEAFSVSRYETVFMDQMRTELGDPNAFSLSRSEVDSLYPLFRGRFWSARDTALNLRFGGTLYPFLEPDVISEALAIPTRYKNHGLIQARMIELINPKLADISSSYGFAFKGFQPNFKLKVKSATSIYRPARLRRLTYRIQHRNSSPTSGLDLICSKDDLGQDFDTRLPYMSKLFKIDSVSDPEVLDRIVAMEYIAQTFSFQDKSE